jgi:hypothetical protein
MMVQTYLRKQGMFEGEIVLFPVPGKHGPRVPLGVSLDEAASLPDKYLITFVEEF